jgi:hypothetical protein
MFNHTFTQQPEATPITPLVPVNFMGTPGGGFRFGQRRIDFLAHLATLTPAPKLQINFGDGKQFQINQDTQNVPLLKS